MEMDAGELDGATAHFIGKYPNTYTFTKALSEHILLSRRRDDLKMCVFRPTIIGPSLNEPSPGWLDTGACPRRLLCLALAVGDAWGRYSLLTLTRTHARPTHHTHLAAGVDSIGGVGPGAFGLAWHSAVHAGEREQDRRHHPG